MSRGKRQIYAKKVTVCLLFVQKRKTVSLDTVFASRLALYLVENLLAIVETALLANALSEIHLTAVGALCHCGSLKLPNAGASGVSASLRSFCLWYCHVATSWKQ